MALALEEMILPHPHSDKASGGLNDLEPSAFHAPLESPALDQITRISILAEISTAISAKRQADALERIAGAVTGEGSHQLHNLFWELGQQFGRGQSTA